MYYYHQLLFLSRHLLTDTLALRRSTIIFQPQLPDLYRLIFPSRPARKERDSFILGRFGRTKTLFGMAIRIGQFDRSGSYFGECSFDCRHIPGQERVDAS